MPQKIKEKYNKAHEALILHNILVSFVDVPQHQGVCIGPPSIVATKVGVDNTLVSELSGKLCHCEEEHLFRVNLVAARATASGGDSPREEWQLCFPWHLLEVPFQVEGLIELLELPMEEMGCIVGCSIRYIVKAENLEGRKLGGGLLLLLRNVKKERIGGRQ